MSDAATTVLAIVSDVHAGSTVAVCPPTIELDDGGFYQASRPQQWLWGRWGAFWDRVDAVRALYKADRLYSVFNGDLTEGDHHKTTQILSGNLTAQAAVVDACMKAPLALGPDQLVFVRGTEAHVGPAASHEESYAKGLRAAGHPVLREPETKRASWWHFRGVIQGIRLDIAHHGRTGQREHTRVSAATLHAHDIYLSYTKNGHRPPHLAVRAHHHKWNDSGPETPVRVITTGAWQLKTGHAHTKVTDSISDIGALIVVIRDGVLLEPEKVKYQPKRGPVWRAPV